MPLHFVSSSFPFSFSILDFLTDLQQMKANDYEPGWQWSFFGPNYARLRTIKEKYDPEGVMWGPNAVGSEDWVLLQDEKLCKTEDIPE